MPPFLWRPRQVRDKPVTSPLAQISLRRLPRNFPVRGSFGEVGVLEFRLKMKEMHIEGRGRLLEAAVVEPTAIVE